MQGILPLLSFLGILITCLVTFKSGREIARYGRQTSSLVEQFKARTGLQMACLDKRLQAHQESFALWNDVMHANDDKAFAEAHNKCSDWWAKNCLYLEPNVSQAFVRATMNAVLHRKLIVVQADAKAVTDAWAEFAKFPKVLFDAVKLPALTDPEFEAINSRVG